MDGVKFTAENAEGAKKRMRLGLIQEGEIKKCRGIRPYARRAIPAEAGIQGGLKSSRPLRER